MPENVSRLQRGWLGTRLFLSNYVLNGAREPRPQRITTTSGAQLELYEPDRQARASVLLISGVSVLGEEEPRLIRLARGMTATGVRVAIPILHALKSLRFHISDLQAARDCLRYMLDRFGHPVSIVAVSAGGSIALTLSAEPEFAHRIRLITLLSPICNPHETMKIVEEIAHTPITDLQNADNEIWVHMVNAYRHAETLGFTPAEKESIRDHLYRYTLGLTAAEKITFHQNVISKRPMNGHKSIDEKEALDAVSPIGRLARSSARVVVIHDANDFVVPVTHIRALERELAQRTPPNHRLLITPALSHVTLQPRYVLDILRMIDHIGELYA